MPRTERDKTPVSGGTWNDSGRESQEKRPVNRQIDRLRVLAALSCVDYITVFNQDTPLKLIKLLRPDILIKGGDWETDKIIGAEFVKSYGGRVLTIPYLKGYSTTGLIARLKDG